MANLLTALRLLLAAPTTVAFARPDLLSPWLLPVFLAVAIATDHFDGKAARAAKNESAGGRLFDHTTDFVFVTAGLAGAAASDQVPLVLPILIAIAFSQYVLDSYWLHRDKQLRMSLLGKWNGILYFVPLVTIAVARLDLVGAVRPLWGPLLAAMSYALIASTVASMIDRALAPLERNGPAPRGSKQAARG